MLLLIHWLVSKLRIIACNHPKSRCIRKSENVKIQKNCIKLFFLNKCWMYELLDHLILMMLNFPLNYWLCGKHQKPIKVLFRYFFFFFDYFVRKMFNSQNFRSQCRFFFCWRFCRFNVLFEFCGKLLGFLLFICFNASFMDIFFWVICVEIFVGCLRVEWKSRIVTVIKILHCDRWNLGTFN